MQSGVDRVRSVDRNSREAVHLLVLQRSEGDLVYDNFQRDLRALRLRPRLQIDDHVANRLRAADEEVAVGRLVEWLRSVDDRPGDQTALTVVTNTGPARPTD